MVPHPRRSTLRRALLLSALLVVGVAAAVVVGSIVVVLSQRASLAREAEAFRDEQRIAEQIVSLTFEQQLDAYRFLERSDSTHLRSFRDRGEQAYGQIRQYLIRGLSPDARLQAEQIKEAHEQFEVSASRAFDLAAHGQPDAARRRLRDLDERAESLASAVDQFLLARAQQRDALRAQQHLFANRVRFALVLAGVALFGLVALLGDRLRRRALRPLEDLTIAARRLGAGDLDARVPPQPYAEFDVVASGFNQMADNVQATRETMESQTEELRQALDHLRRTQAELVQHEKLSAMGQMLAGLAHELNNPLASVLGMAELIRSELAASPDASMRLVADTLAEPLEREALRARSLVRNLLNFARRPSGVIEPVGLATAVSTALGLCAHAFAQEGKTLRVDVKPTLQVMADAQKLQHAVVNVVNNALDAIVAGGGHNLKITAVADDPEGRVRVDFDDDGPGFVDPSAAIVPFYTTKAPGKGTGLGLALVEQFVSEFGGTVTVSNRPGGGARVTLSLRRADADSTVPAHADATVVGESISDFLPDIATEASELAPRPRVLVVDDEPTLRLIQRRLLTRAGMDVVVAASGTEARNVLRREHVDLVISDLRMPGELDGRELLVWLEQEHPALAARSLLLTGDVAGVASVPLPVSADRVVSKPFSGTEYVDRVRRALGLQDN